MMKDKTQALLKKSLSMLLALLMIAAIVPYNAIQAETAKIPTVYSQLSDKAAFNYPGGSGATYSSSGCGVYAIVNAVKYLTDKKIDPHTLGNFAIKNGNRVNGGINGPKFAKDVANNKNFGEQYGFKCTKYYSFGSEKRTMKYRYWSSNEKKYITQTNKLYPSTSEWDKIYDDLKSHISNGEVAVVLVMGHNMAIVDYNPSNDTFLILDSAANKSKRLSKNDGKYQWVTADQLNYQKAPKANSSYNNQGPYIHLRSQIAFLAKTGTKNYNFSSANDVPDSRTNTTNVITSTLNNTANVQSWGYYVGTSKSDVSAHKNYGNETSRFVTVQAYTKSGKSQKTLSTTVNNLKPNQTYWYVVGAKIGDKWYYSSVFWGSTTNITPHSTELKADGGSIDIGINDTATLTWNAAKLADTYTVKLYDSAKNEVYSKTGIQGNSFAFPASCFTKAGTFTAKLWAVNAAGSTEAWGNPSITVHDNVNVTFYDTVSNTDIITQSVTYGHDATPPENPSQNGYTFVGWNGNYSKVTADTTVKANFEANKYTVKFVDSMTGRVYKTETVKYHQSATAPNDFEIKAPQGYTLMGWDRDFSRIEGDTTVNTNYKWYNENYPVDSTITAVIPDKENENSKEINGYKVSVTVKNGSSSSVKKARLVVALKTKSGYLLTETESSAFTLKAGETKNLDVFVPFEDLAYAAEVYTINEYNDLGPVAKPVSAVIDNSNKWSDWIEYTNENEVPVKGVNGVADVKTDTVTTPDITQYRYRVKSTKTSYDSSMPGWYEESYIWVPQGEQYIDYVSNFPSGFDKNNYFYKTYNVSPKSTYENSNEKLDAWTSTQGYIYWHWCRGGNHGAINRGIKWAKTSDYSTFHAFYSTTSKSYDPNANAIKWQKTDQCKDTYWWNTAQSKSSEKVTIKRQTYVISKKLRTFAQWSDWSEWSTTPKTPDATTEVETRIIKGTTTKRYCYKTDNSVKEVNVSNEQIVNIKGNVNKALAGREASVYVYKYTQASDYTNEYIGTTTVGTNGEIIINNAELREAPTVETGDYTIVASVEGCTNSIEIGKILAPKKTFTVKFYDYDRKTVIHSETVEQGATVTSPDIDKLHIPEGYRFTNWNQSTVNINDNLNVYPLYERKTYVVVFVDWTNHTVTLKDAFYGDEISGAMLPKTSDIEGKAVSWDMSNASKVTETLDNGTKVDKYIVTQNTVITTKLETEVHDVMFVAPNKDKVIDIQTSDPEEISNAVNMLGTAKVDRVEYENRVITPSEIEDAPEYIFLGWRNIENGSYLEDTSTVTDGIYLPEYTFAETVDVPEASVKTGEYSTNQTVELTCATDKAVIYYTIDGTNPEISDTAVQYTAPITLTKSCNLQFCAMALGKNNSGVASELYAINASSGAKYHIVTVYTDLLQAEGEYYQALIKDSTLFKDDDLKNIEGYKYDGLYTDDEMTIPFFNDSEVISESMSLYAHYIPNEYTATFKDENGNVIAIVKANYGESAEEPAVPDKEGYVFVGWDSDDYLCMTKDGTFTAKYVSEADYATIEFTTKTYAKECMAGTHLALYRLIKITPADKADTELIWTSINPTVASVDENGLVEMLEPGITTITVTVESSGESAKFEITVTPNPEMQITLAKNSILGFDSERNLREIPDKKNTVAELREQFMNDELHFYKVNGEEYTELIDTDRVGTGTVIRLLDGDKVLDEVTAVMTGDYNGDGMVTTLDGTFLGQYLLKKREANVIQWLAMNVNGDSSVNLHDKALLSQYLVGKAEFKEAI